nr:MAG TPA: hypothetical protein [Caudoviricetes sp.]
MRWRCKKERFWSLLLLCKLEFIGLFARRKY